MYPGAEVPMTSDTWKAVALWVAGLIFIALVYFELTRRMLIM
jgi:hypothetical protein